MKKYNVISLLWMILCLLTHLHTGFLLVHNGVFEFPHRHNGVGYQHNFRCIRVERRVGELSSCIIIFGTLLEQIYPLTSYPFFCFMYLYICLCCLCIVICMHSFHSAHIFIPLFVYIRNSYVYIHWILDLKYISLLLNSNCYFQVFCLYLHRRVYYFEQHNPYVFQKSVLELLLKTLSHC